LSSVALFRIIFSVTLLNIEYRLSSLAFKGPSGRKTVGFDQSAFVKSAIAVVICSSSVILGVVNQFISA